MKQISNEENKLIKRWILQSGGFLIVYLPINLLIANDVRWVQGWVYWFILLIFLALHPILLIPINPQLLAERARGTQYAGTKKWDKILTMVGPGLMPFASQIISALDHRFDWSVIFPLIQILSFILVLLGYGFFLWAMVSNSYFAEGVRIQTERGHCVCSSGPYKYVRHPGYAGSILAIIGTPLLLNSIWGIIPAIFGVILISIRTYLEDRTLKQELEGYQAYAQKVKNLLIPRIF